MQCEMNVQQVTFHGTRFCSTEPLSLNGISRWSHAKEVLAVLGVSGGGTGQEDPKRLFLVVDGWSTRSVLGAFARVL